MFSVCFIVPSPLQLLLCKFTTSKREMSPKTLYSQNATLACKTGSVIRHFPHPAFITEVESMCVNIFHALYEYVVTNYPGVVLLCEDCIDFLL